MPERHIRICNKLGLHARASARLASEASRFTCNIHLLRDDVNVNCKSIMGIMMLAAAKGTELLLQADGPDADAALDALERVVNERFGEAE
ncbi:HPr family phosphocarrier protein [Mariprofundus ferrooxydans]|uniref:HPr family phosphocarrier protein n=1 Tax=Mariprofundus ferrooxydans TaxID=314344 RepID=UPI001431C496|nr:HPr family phosphocarrier protein [Mariprofundus ferrooxydans]